MAFRNRVELPCYGIVLETVFDVGQIRSDLHDFRSNPDEYDAAINGLESLILAHYMAGVDVSSPGYVEGIETAVEAIGNNYGD